MPFDIQRRRLRLPSSCESLRSKCYHHRDGPTAQQVAYQIRQLELELELVNSKLELGNSKLETRRKEHLAPALLLWT